MILPFEGGQRTKRFKAIYNYILEEQRREPFPKRELAELTRRVKEM